MLRLGQEKLVHKKVGGKKRVKLELEATGVACPAAVSSKLRVCRAVHRN